MNLLKLHGFALLLIVAGLLPPSAVQSQSKILKGYIKDALSDERVPFASINFIKSGNGKLSDSAGNFIFHFAQWPEDTLLVSYVGYKDFKIFTGGDFPKKIVDSQLNFVINLERGKTVAEVVVKRKIDRGYLMWKRIVKHKPENDRYRFNNFSYELYNKMELDLNRINRDKIKNNRLLRPFDFVLDNTGTFIPFVFTAVLTVKCL